MGSGLVRSLHTQTGFSFRQNALLRLDLEKSVCTLRKDHAGCTQTDSLTGLLAT